MKRNRAMSISEARVDPGADKKPATRDERIANLAIFGGVIVLAIAGYFLYSQFANYTFHSDRHIADLMRAKIWTLLWLFASIIVIYWRRRSSYAPLLAVLALSAYFVVLYAILFRGTEYGMNGHWGDNGNRLAEIVKMMAYKTFFTDWYLKDLPSFYPPLWFGAMALYAKALGIQAYQTIKWGYLLVFLVYPWLLYFAWRNVVSRVTAAAIAVATLFFGYKYMDWIYYEHMTAALFLPWWLYYFERAEVDGSAPKANWRFYVIGAVYGGLLFMTYYYWFFVALGALPITLVGRYIHNRSVAELWRDLRHKAILMAGVAVVSAVYWLPLLRSIRRFGSESSQNAWWGLRHTNLTGQWDRVSLESLMIFAGIFFAAYLWKRFGSAKLIYFFLGGLVLIVVDRAMNLGGSSIQSRKVLEFVHVFAMAPLAIGVVTVWAKLTSRRLTLYGVTAVLILASVVVANTQSETGIAKFYQIGVNQRVPSADLKAFDSVETYNKVYLTSHYIEDCYLPYYLFIPVNNMTAHTAGRYSERRAFLEQAARILEPDILAYVLAYNRYSPIDYVYLPVDTGSGHLQFTLYRASFNHDATGETLTFSADHTSSPDVFVKRAGQGIYELKPAERSARTDEVIKSKYPDIYRHLQPIFGGAVIHVEN